eukprot:595387-Alexandrium_andersonii.AAC.1
MHVLFRNKSLPFSSGASTVLLRGCGLCPGFTMRTGGVGNLVRDRCTVSGLAAQSGSGEG